MFRPKKHLKLDLLKSAPSINDLKQALDHARKLRGCTIELPWDLEQFKISFALAVRIEAGVDEAFWTLHTGQGDNSHILWNAPFNDLSLLKEVILLSLAEITGTEDTFSYKETTKTSLNSEPKEEIEQSLSSAIDESIGSNLSALPSSNTQQMPYVYYPDYPYPVPMPFSSGMPTPANSISLQQGMPILNPNSSSSRLPAPDIDLLRKQTNYMIGQFLVESKLIAESTLKIALKLQELVVGNVISTNQAYEAINRIHHKGGYLDIAQLIKDSPTSGNTINAPKQSYTLLGDLLVKSQVINRSILDAVLKMQEIVRAGAISKDEACQAIIKELTIGSPTQTVALKPNLTTEQKIIDLLFNCSLISAYDIETALNVQKEHGGQLGQILVSAGKLDLKAYQAAVEGESLLQQNKIKLEQVIIALNYCTRTRTNLNDAINELGFISTSET